MRAHPRASALALSLVVLYVVLGVVATLVHLRNNQALGGGFLLALPAVFAAYPLVGALIILRRGSHPIGWILQAIGVTILIMTGSGAYANYALVLHPGSLPLGQVATVLNNVFWIVGIFLFAVMLPMLFPTGRLLSKRWLVIVALALLYCILAGVGNGLQPGAGDSNYPKLVNPIAVYGHDQLLRNLAGASIIPAFLALVGVIASIIVRFRRSRGLERQQLKYFVFGAMLMPFPLLLNGVTPLDQITFVVVLPLMAVGIGIAVLRHGLYGIDVVISRTLVYGALAAFITAVYVGIVVGFGTLIGSGGKPNLALSIVATAVVAVGFQPVRERVQKIANRLVFGERATPYEVLSEFAERVAESYAADEVLPRMARVLAEGAAAEAATVWLRAGDELRPAATHPTDANGLAPIRVTGQVMPEIPQTDRAVPVLHRGELLGALSLRKRRGESFTPIEEKLVDDLAHQAGLVLKNVGLSSELLRRLDELRESRQRLLRARDEERRRLERNLHDGAQQNLVAVMAKLCLAEEFAEKDPQKLKELIRQLKAETVDTLESMRDLARGIYPPLLADKGLKDALEAQARRATVPVTVEAEDIGRHPQEVEATVYFCCLEALQNVQKHAGASAATIRLKVQDGELSFEVEDDGRGFDAATFKNGPGLQNMEDRLDALGGALQVGRASLGGASVSGRLGRPVMELA
jgi:signal transduction histidine kinase